MLKLACGQDLTPGPTKAHIGFDVRILTLTPMDDPETLTGLEPALADFQSDILPLENRVFL